MAYDTGDYYHSIAWLEEAVSRFRLSYGSWNPEEERGSLEDALDHLAFSYFMVRPPAPSPAPPGPSRGPGAPHTLSAPTQAGNISHALTLSKEFLHYGTGLSLVSGCPRHLCVPPAPLPSFFWHGRGKSPRTEAKEVGDGDVGLWVTPPRPSRPQ